MEKIGVSFSMMIAGMVFFMSLFGTAMHPNSSQGLLMTLLSNIGKNIVVVLPLQLVIVGPIAHRFFRKLFLVGTV